MGAGKVQSLVTEIEVLSDEELDAIIDRARQRAGTLGDEAVAAIISEAVRAVRTQSRS
ncbi:MAG TPA: hypothetical protein VK548_08185 [Candidatus Acidoferrum sp.]|nr:hypothetical protein [Candidatus Acidoferrum sp.]